MSSMHANIGYWAMIGFFFAAFGNTLLGGIAGLVGGVTWFIVCQLLERCDKAKCDKPRK